ncbi:DoxX family protein [Novosphingobium sp. KCTC 2891]|uniref:DoxX family protein n=1 Tax=Novosphingobium sp. KCTC 2891 TaxID=2989730 RepID=UPI002221A9C8|nr:DoxX family protein [Novosphingobium sp. KCTC 2891]MCW1381374.1 DoxX family protein [Novosphingobium sp. KCTC 2891]
MTTAAATPVSASTATPAQPLLAAGGRVLLAAIFVLSGVSKLTAPAATLAYITSAGLPLPQVALAAAILIELGGGLALIAGYRPRLVALLLAGFSVVTAFAFHGQLGDQNQFIHFFKNIAMAGGLMQVAAFGGGRIAIHRD